MKTFLKILLVLAVLGGAAAAAYRPVTRWIAKRGETHYRTEEVSRGRVEFVVSSTGTIKPVKSVIIGSFVSGPVKEIFVDFNDEVKKDQPLAKIDPRLYEANVQRDRAILETQKADVVRVQAQLQQAVNDEQRARRLRERNEDFISQTEMDKLRFGREVLEAQLIVARAAVDQAQASYENSKANLDYTEIRSPVDGRVIECKIDPGNTIAAQFQTPELFVIAPDMEKTMHVFANVDEADIGFIRDAQKKDMPVFFTVDAYPDDKFEGRIHQVRMSSTTTQNVVTYPVVITAANPGLKLMPGMTATISFHVDVRENVLRVPNAALLFFPSPGQVRPQDRHLVEPANNSRRAATEDVAYNQRHVWVQDEALLRAVTVRTGANDTRFTEIVGGDLNEGQAVVIGLQLPELEMAAR